MFPGLCTYCDTAESSKAKDLYDLMRSSGRISAELSLEDFTRIYRNGLRAAELAAYQAGMRLKNPWD